VAINYEATGTLVNTFPLCLEAEKSGVFPVTRRLSRDIFRETGSK